MGLVCSSTGNTQTGVVGVGNLAHTHALAHGQCSQPASGRRWTLSNTLANSRWWSQKLLTHFLMFLQSCTLQATSSDRMKDALLSLILLWDMANQEKKPGNALLLSLSDRVRLSWSTGGTWAFTLTEQCLIFHKEVAEKCLREDVADEGFMKSRFLCFSCWMLPYQPLLCSPLCTALQLCQELQCWVNTPNMQQQR